MTWQFHQPTFDFLGHLPAFSESRVKQLSAVAQRYGIAFDAAVVEWFANQHTDRLLREHSTYQTATALPDLGSETAIVGLAPEYNRLVANRKCIRLFEEQMKERLEWFLAPDGTANPKVLLRAEGFEDMLLPHPHRFATLLYLHFWDARVRLPHLEGYRFHYEDGAFRQTWLAALRPHFDQLTTTFYLFANRTVHRFQKQQQQILIWENDTVATDWFVYAPTPDALTKIAALLRTMGVKG